MSWRTFGPLTPTASSNSAFQALHNIEKEQLAPVFPALLSSLLHGARIVYGSVVDTWRTRLHARNGQYLRTRIHVLLLLPDCIQSGTQAFNLVEETHHSVSNGSNIHAWVGKFSIPSFQCQFAFLIVHFLRGALAKNCSYPKFWMWTLVIQNTFMFTLFADFYYKAYVKKRK